MIYPAIPSKKKGQKRWNWWMFNMNFFSPFHFFGRCFFLGWWGGGRGIYLFVGTHNWPTRLTETNPPSISCSNLSLQQDVFTPKNGQETNHKEPNLKMWNAVRFFFAIIPPQNKIYVFCCVFSIWKLKATHAGHLIIPSMPSSTTKLKIWGVHPESEKIRDTMNIQIKKKKLPSLKLT